MPKTRIITFGLMAALFGGLPALATTEQRVETFIIDDAKHPTAYQQAFAVSDDSEGDVYLCFGYANTLNKSNTGSLLGKASITRFDPETDEGTVEKFGKHGNLKANKWLRCRQTGPVLRGDMVVIDYFFGGFPRPRGGTIHIRSGLGMERLLISELRGPEKNIPPGEPTEIHHRARAFVIENGKHRKTWQQGWVISEDTGDDSEGTGDDSEGTGDDSEGTGDDSEGTGDKVHFCFGYGNNFKKGNQGEVVGIAEITRLDPETEETSLETIKRKGNVRKNKFVKCAEIEPVRLGDSVVVDYEFTGFPRLRGNAKVAGAVAAGGDAFEVATGVGTSELGKPELLGPAPEGGGDGGGDDGGGGGGFPDPPTSGALSAADQAAIRRLFGPTFSHAQLWRPKGNLNGKWTTIDNKTQVSEAFPLNVNPNTVGHGATPAEAVADLERKNGKHPAVGGGLSAAEQDCIAWMGTINPSQGSTSIRFGPNGSGWHGEWFHPATGPVGLRAKGLLDACQKIRANRPV